MPNPNRIVNAVTSDAAPTRDVIESRVKAIRAAGVPGPAIEGEYSARYGAELKNHVAALWNTLDDKTKRRRHLDDPKHFLYAELTALKHYR